ncbi:hypothetical protein TRICI_006434 [Trichomonascus ciferrii]|uniref:UBA domain-containing protein n=1 Tax=Trichomonascus ciferrii TaxID=44093 RepID=A0A642UH19_9ASCO|nr:hypothetical protein TRICI_006434 [Trichomonascus ciferrii]
MLGCLSTLRSLRSITYNLRMDSGNKEEDGSREESIRHIVEMGFTRKQAMEALEHCNNDISRAVQYIFAGADAQAQAEENVKEERPETAHYEDTDLAAAVQNSMEQDTPYPGGFQPSSANNYEQSLRQQQETGVVQFGPAQRDYYEPEKWGVVPYSEQNSNSNDSSWRPSEFTASTGSVVLEPQLRLSDTPPLLLPNPDMLYIAPLLVILHSVPLARKALLNGSKDLISDYGFEPNWWREPSIDLSEQMQHPLGSVERALIETQRLMAFLDGGSKRACADIANLVFYGAIPESADSLKGITSSDSPTGRFLEDFLLYWGRDTEFAKVFELGAKSNDQAEVQQFTNLIADVTVDIEKSLYDIIDELVWPSQNTDETYLHHLGDVVHITLKRDDGNSGVGIDVPSTWYPDRYLKEVAPFIGEIRSRRREMQNELSKLSKQKFQLSTYMGKDATKLLQITADYFRQESERDEGLLSSFEDIDRVKSEFENRKSDLFQRISDLGDQIDFERNLFKGENPPGFEKIFPDANTPSLRPYHLCGAIISPTEYCFKCSVDSYGSDDLIELDSDKMEPASNWWRVQPNPSTGEPMAERVSDADVLAYAKEGSKDYSWQEVILFYANEYALDQSKHNIQLSEGLQNFISRDRKALVKQVQREQQKHQQEPTQQDEQSLDGSQLNSIDSPMNDA